jgi:hypothetical protein
MKRKRRRITTKTGREYLEDKSVRQKQTVKNKSKI